MYREKLVIIFLESIEFYIHQPRSYVIFFDLFKSVLLYLYYLKHLSELNPDYDFALAFSPEERMILNIRSKREFNSVMMMEEAMKAMAKVGGFNGRKSDGSPGMVSQWRGLVKLQTLDLLKL